MPSLSYLSPKVATRESPIHGTGLFAVEPFAEGEVVCVKGGYVFDRRRLDSMPDWYRAAENDCNCGAAHCRKVLTGKDWQKEELQERYSGYFSSYLQEKISRTK
jgi:transcription initiation factor TFIIIB Brf1 subunit/transcription initiation factor TFIIB